MKISDEARARLLSTTSNLLDHKGVDHLASGLMQKAVRSDADDADESKGHWVTTENNHKLFINGEGEPTKGNPHVLAAARGEKGPKNSASAAPSTGKYAPGKSKEMSSEFSKLVLSGKTKQAEKYIKDFPAGTVLECETGYLRKTEKGTWDLSQDGKKYVDVAELAGSSWTDKNAVDMANTGHTEIIFPENGGDKSSGGSSVDIEKEAEQFNKLSDPDKQATFMKNASEEFKNNRASFCTNTLDDFEIGTTSLEEVQEDLAWAKKMGVLVNVEKQYREKNGRDIPDHYYGPNGKKGMTGGNRPSSAERSNVEKYREERGGVARKMYEAGEIPQDTMGILDSMNYSDKIMDRAVERGWITKEQAGKIKGETTAVKEPERRTISAHGGEKDYKISVGDACQSLLDKPTSEVTYSDTRKAIAEFKEEFKKAVEAAKEYKKIGTYDASFGASDIRDTFQEYAKEMRKKFYDIEKNANKKTSEGRIAAKDASDFLWDNAGCDVEKIYTSGFGDWTKM